MTSKAKAKAKPETTETEAVPENQSGVVLASKAEHDGTDHERYGAVKPTMVNGQYIGDDTPAKRELTLHEQIAAAFPNERQINVVQQVAALASGGKPVVADETAPVDSDLATRVADCEAKLKALLESTASALNELREESVAKDTKIAELEAKLAQAAPVEPAPTE
jgi:hypothetical protein